MAKHIGIVAVSAEGAALCYRTICREGADLLGRHAHPEISTHTIPLSEYMIHIESGNWGQVGELMACSGAKLRQIGAAFLVCPDNTVHQAFDHVDLAARSGIPWLHIAEVVALRATEKQYRKIGVLGTRFLMEGPVYPSRLGPAGLGWQIPEERDRVRINTIIFDELVYGELQKSSRDYFCQVIEGLKRNGCDAVVLGCTEIPLLISDEVSPLPCLDSTRLLARAALQRALRPTPDSG